MGEVIINSIINESTKTKLRTHLVEKGFKLIEDKNAQLIAQIKSIIIAQIHHSTEILNINFSTYISDELQQDYTFLSKLFSSNEQITIERFILNQKIERVKELLL